MSLTVLNRISCVIFNKGVGCSCHSLKSFPNSKTNIIRSVNNIEYNINNMRSLTTVMLCSSRDEISKIKSKGHKYPISSRFQSSDSKNILKSAAGSNDNNNKDNKQEQQVSIKDKVKLLWKTYGVTAIGFYIGIYLTTLGSIFFSLDFDVFNAASVGLDPVSAIKKVCDLVETVTGNTALPGYIRDNPRVGTFAVAWVMTKFTEPLRLGVTIITLPSFARFIGKAPPLNNSPNDNKN